MRYLKIFEKFTNKSDIIKEIHKIFDRLNVSYIRADMDDYYENENDVVVPNMNCGDMVTSLERDDMNRIWVELYDNESISDAYGQININKLNIKEIESIYEYFKDITLNILLNRFYNSEDSYGIEETYDRNYDKIDLDNIFGDNIDFFSYFNGNPYPFYNEDSECIVNNYHFQKWLIEKHIDKINWLNENKIEWCDEIKKEYSDIIEGAGMGFFDLKTNENKKYDEKQELINKIDSLFDKLNVSYIRVSSDENNDEIPFVFEDYLLNSIEKMNNKKSILVTIIDYFTFNLIEKDVEEFNIEELKSIYYYFKFFTLKELLKYIIDRKEYVYLIQIYDRNYDKIDLDNITGKGVGFFDIWIELSNYIFNEIEGIIYNYHFQKWLMEKHPDKIKIITDKCDIVWDDKIKEEYPEIIEGNAMGFFDLKTNENIQNEKSTYINLIKNIFIKLKVDTLMSDYNNDLLIFEDDYEMLWIGIDTNMDVYILCNNTKPNYNDNPHKEKLIKYMVIDEIKKIYDYFKNISLKTLIDNYISFDKAFSSYAYLSEIYNKNSDRIDLDDMTSDGKSFFDILGDDVDDIGDDLCKYVTGCECIIHNYYFQKWILDKHPEKISWFKEYKVDWDDKIKKDYPETVSLRQAVTLW